jgi:hypothetical protein
VEVTLSFDNGPEPAVTPRVLDVLEAANIRATFFVLGSKLADKQRRAIAKRAHATGHWIGNHTWTHSQPLGRISLPSIGVSAVVVAGAQRASRRRGVVVSLVGPERLLREAVAQAARMAPDETPLEVVDAPEPTFRDFESRGADANRAVIAALIVSIVALFTILAWPILRGEVYVADDLGEFHLPLRAFYAQQLAHGESSRKNSRADR